MNKNDEARLEVYDLHADGQGVAKWADGRTVFVAEAFPGDVVWARIIKVEKSYAYARVIKILEPSADRVEGSHVCPVAGPCGGCQFQYYEYAAQLKFKEKLVRDALSRIGNLQNFEISPIVGMDKPYNYRNKAQFPQGLGLYAARSHRIVPVLDCNIMHPTCIEVLQTVQKMAIPNLRHLVIRVGQNTGEVMVIFVMSDDSIPSIDDINADTILVNENSANTNVILGKKFTTLKGSGYIREELGHVRYRISPQAFFQVNSTQAKVLYDIVAEQVSGKVIDAYCGTGSIALYVANHVEEVVGIESVAEAVKDAEYNAQLNDIKNARFLCGHVEDLVPELLKKQKHDAIILDPPRKGCDGKLIDTIIESGIKKVVYVSCNPTTLARDVKLLCGAGYGVKYVRPVDMFPMTRHVECVVVLER